MKASLVRNIANRLVQQADIISSYNRRPWVQAMTIEVNYIRSDLEALDFAIGCFTVTFLEEIRMQKFEPLIRWILAFIALTWACCKIYLFTAIFRNGAEITDPAMPVWLYVILITAALSYAGSAYSLIKRKHLLFGLFFIAALVTNSALFALTQLQFLLLDFHPTEKLTWFFALISEEYFMWSAILFGAAVLFVLRNFNRAKAVLWSA